MSDDLIPFGKYRGQPIEALANDHQYADWLAAQPWFRERYSSLYTVIINNFTVAADTPEHNKLQARLLDDIFTTNLIKIASPAMDVTAVHVSFEDSGLDAGIRVHYNFIDSDGKIWHTDQQFVIEVKPTIGDDYPTVLRQIKRAVSSFKRYILLYGEYVGGGVDEETFRRIFLNEHITPVRLSDLP